MKAVSKKNKRENNNKNVNKKYTCEKNKKIIIKIRKEKKNINKAVQREINMYVTKESITKEGKKK